MGSHRANDIENYFFLKLCKRFLGVKANCNNMVYIELKCLSFRSVRIIRMIKYWIKLLGTTNCILKPCYVNFTKYCKAKRPCSNLAVFINIQNCIALVNYGNTRNTLCSHKHFPIIKMFAVKNFLLLLKILQNVIFFHIHVLQILFACSLFYSNLYLKNLED